MPSLVGLWVSAGWHAGPMSIGRDAPAGAAAALEANVGPRRAGARRACRPGSVGRDMFAAAARRACDGRARISGVSSPGQGSRPITVGAC